MSFPEPLSIKVYADLRSSETVLRGVYAGLGWVRKTSASVGTNATTIEFWVKSKYYGSQVMFRYEYSATVLMQINSYQSLTYGPSMAFHYNTNIKYFYGVNVVDGSLHHVAISIDHSTGECSLYIDGKLRSTHTFTSDLGLTSGGEINLMSDYNAGITTGWLDGEMADFRWWNDIRTESEILHEKNFRLAGNESDLNIYYKMDDNSGTLVDSCGSQDATLANLIWMSDEFPFFTELTDDIEPSTFAWTRALGAELDTVDFTIDTWAGDEINKWDELVIEVDDERIFGGFITQLEKSEGSDLTVKYHIGASDYGVVFSHILLTADYTGASDYEIISDIVKDNCPWIGIDNVQDILTHSETFRVNLKFAREIIDKLAELGRAEWYVDQYADLYYFLSETAEMDFDLSDDPDYSDTFPFYGLVIHEGGGEICNRMEVKGGTYLSGDEYMYIAGTGKSPKAIMPFRMRAATTESEVLVWRNDGTEGTPNWIAMDVLAGNLDTLSDANDVLYFFQEKVLEQQSNWPNLPNAIKVYGRYEIPLRSRVRDYESYYFYGRWFDDYIVDKNIKDKTTARLAGLAELAKRSFGKETITLYTRVHNLIPGRKINLVSTLFGIDDEFIIQRVYGNMRKRGYVVYTISLGLWNDDLINLIIELYSRRKHTADWIDNEVLDEVLDIQDDVELDSETHTVSARNPSTSAYKWRSTPLDTDYWEWGYAKWIT